MPCGHVCSCSRSSPFCWPAATVTRLHGRSPATARSRHRRRSADPEVDIAVDPHEGTRLAAQVKGQGLTLTYLDCPAWDHEVPTRMVCKGYVDGLVARVVVHLEAAVEGRAVGFDARLLDGVIATGKLERTLRHSGWTRADCGDTPAYPARVGSRIVCHVSRAGDDRYLVATVSDRSGAVMIADYAPRS